MAKIIKNGIIVTATDHYKADLLIDEGVVQAIGMNLQVEAS